MFTDFEPKPLGAASLAQVHKAKLPDGTIVAVKVQHPKVKAHSFVDIKTMEVCFVFLLVVLLISSSADLAFHYFPGPILKD